MMACPQCGCRSVGRSRAGEQLANIYFRCLDNEVWNGDKCVSVSPREMDIFEAIYDAGRRGITPEDLYNFLHPDHADADMPTDLRRSLSVRVCNLRKKLRPISVVIRLAGGRYFLSV